MLWVSQEIICARSEHYRKEKRSEVPRINRSALNLAAFLQGLSNTLAPSSVVICVVAIMLTNADIATIVALSGCQVLKSQSPGLPVDTRCWTATASPALVTLPW